MYTYYLINNMIFSDKELQSVYRFMFKEEPDFEHWTKYKNWRNDKLRTEKVIVLPFDDDTIMKLYQAERIDEALRMCRHIYCMDWSQASKHISELLEKMDGD